VHGNIRLWKVWWLWGIALALVTFVLARGADRAYLGGAPVLGALLDAVRLVAYLAWFHAVWRASRNVEHALWTYLARAAALVGLLANAVLY